MYQKRTNNKILIIQTAFLGDVILTTPLIAAVREGIPDSQIDFLTIPNSRNVVESNPALRRVIIFDKKGRDCGWQGLHRLGRLLVENNYSLCLTPHRSWRSAYLTRCSKAPVRIGFDNSAWSSVFTHQIKYKNDAHEITRNLSLLEPLGLQPIPRLPAVYPTIEDQQVIDSLLGDLAGEKPRAFFAIAPGSIWPTKRWPAQYFKFVAEKLIANAFHVLFIGGNEDTILCGKIALDLKHCTVLTGKLSIRQTFQLLQSHCQGLLTNDSAPLHLALAAAIPVFAVFGATVPEFGFAPFGGNGYIFENREISCRPCGIHGGAKCPVRTYACMEQVNPHQIAEQIINITVSGRL
jgi:lipopolysaccharide heptosyltransferase II